MSFWTLRALVCSCLAFSPVSALNLPTPNCCCLSITGFIVIYKHFSVRCLQWKYEEDQDTFGICNFIAEKKIPLLTYFTKKVALWCWVSFLPHPFPLDSDAWETRTTSPCPFRCVQRYFPALPACTSSSQDGVLFSTSNLPLFVPKTSSTLPSSRGNKSVAREIALRRQCLIQKLWSCDNCPLVFMQ